MKAGSRQNKNRQQCCSGYEGMLTVEAAFIIPIVWFIIMAMLSFGLYFIDQAKVRAACDEVLGYASQAVGKGCDLGNGKVQIETLNRMPLYSFPSYGKEKQELHQRLQKRLKGKLLFLRPDKIEVTVNHKELKILLSGKALPFGCGWFRKVPFSFSYTSTVQRADYSSILRKTDAVRKGKEKQ